ncbi:glycosyltransferase [Myxococcota bacterium]|nr:glycosyltransferase [Myxococcota bacterium]
MTPAPRVSVVIPAYNAAAYLDETLASALAQTYPVHEILVVDDGSTDGTGAVIEAWHGRDPRVRRIRQPNCGISATRNHGAAVATGEWLAWLDADDRWVPEKLERQILARDARVSLVYTDRRNFGERGPLPEIASEHIDMPSGEVFEALLCQGNFITTSSVVQTRDSFWSVGGFTTDERVPVCEDWDLWLRLAAAGHTVQCILAPLTEYRVHAVSTSRSPKRMTVAREAVVERALNTPAGRSLPFALRQRVRGETLRTNAWDFHRHGFRREAALAAARAVAAWPASLESVRELLRVVVTPAG